MFNINKLVIIGGAIALALIVGISVYKNHSASAPSTDGRSTIKIGVSLPLTGNLAVYGRALQKSLDLSLHDAQKNNLKYNYKIVVEDDAYDLKTTMVNLNRFKSIDNVDAVMSFWGNAGTLTSDWAEKNKVIHMSCALSDKVGVGYYNFNHATQPKTVLSRLLKFYQDNNFKRVGIAYLRTLEIQEFVDNLVPFLKQNNLDVVFTTAFSPQVRDMRIEILKMKEAKPDVMAVFMNSPVINIFGKQSRDLGFNVPKSSINNMTDALDEYEGQSYITEDSGKSEFTRHYEKSTGMVQTACVVNFYDGLHMLINAYEKTPPSAGDTIPSNEDIVETLLDLEHNGFESVIEGISMDAEGNIDSPAVLKRIIHRKPTIVDK